MANVLERTAYDLSNNYSEIIDLANEGNEIIITQDGHRAAAVIGMMAYRDYEEYLHHQYIARELDKSLEKSKDPNTKWISHEEFWAEFEEYL